MDTTEATRRIANARVPVVRVALALVLLVLALARTIDFSRLGQRMDATFLMLVGGAALVLLVPWERLTALKAGQLELALENPNVGRALAQLPDEITLRDGDTDAVVAVDAGQIEAQLRALAPVLPSLKGRRILWIDDHPRLLVEERRLLRSLGLVIVPCLSSAEASAELRRDSDIDLVISDVSRRKETEWPEAARSGTSGVEFVVRRLRTDWDEEVRRLPVIFYSCYDRQRLEAATLAARQAEPPAQACNSPQELVALVLRELLVARPRNAMAGKRVRYREKKSSADDPKA